MVLGKVIGTLVASRKEPTLDGLKLLVVRACDVDGNATGGIAVAVDAVAVNSFETPRCRCMPPRGAARAALL